MARLDMMTWILCQRTFVRTLTFQSCPRSIRGLRWLLLQHIQPWLIQISKDNGLTFEAWGKHKLVIDNRNVTYYHTFDAFRSVQLLTRSAISILYWKSKKLLLQCLQALWKPPVEAAPCPGQQLLLGISATAPSAFTLDLLPPRYTPNQALPITQRDVSGEQGTYGNVTEIGFSGLDSKDFPLDVMYLKFS